MVARLQGDNYWTKAGPSYFDFLSFWDAEWYSRIFDHGYPTELPTNTDGSAKQNEWAFLPAFPYLVRLINLATGIEWKFLAPIVALLFSFTAAVLAFKLFERHVGNRTALWAVGIFGLWGASPTLQAGYAESMGIALIAATLLLVDRQRYLASLIPTAVLSITRPGALAIALMRFDFCASLVAPSIRPRLYKGALEIVDRHSNQRPVGFALVRSCVVSDGTRGCLHRYRACLEIGLHRKEPL